MAGSRGVSFKRSAAGMAYLIAGILRALFSAILEESFVLTMRGPWACHHGQGGRVESTIGGLAGLLP